MRKLTILLAFMFMFLPIARAQFSSLVSLKPLPVTTDLKEKPQTKIWHHDDLYWSILTNEEGTHVWRLDDKSWTNVLTIGISSYGRADCKVAGNVVHVFLYRKERSHLVSIEYDPLEHTYKLWSARPERVLINLPSAAETGTIELDTKNRMWLTYDDSTSILARWSDSPYTNWSDPITIATGITNDDIGAIMAFPMYEKVGILWSDQRKQRFGFRMHPDGAAPDDWLADEVPASQSALDFRGGMANDHLNMTLSSDGTLYCAVKTSYNRPEYPRVALLVRRPSGLWDELYNVSNTGTRGIALLNEAVGKIRVVYTASENSGDIVYRESDLKPIAFGNQHVLIPGKFDNSTSLRNSNGSRMLILANDSLKTVGVMATDALNLHLEANPNPAVLSTEITFSVPARSNYSLTIYNVTGTLYGSLKKGYAKYGERHKLTLDTSKMPFGLYILRLQADKRTRYLKLIHI